MNNTAPVRTISRRAFLRWTAAGTGMAGACVTLEAADEAEGVLRFGLVTDVHYADADTRGTRHYRDSMGKLEQAIDTFNRADVRFVVELGDFIDSGRTKAGESGHLKAIDRVYCRSRADRYYVLGNHCLNALAKGEFLHLCRSRIKRSYYSFEQGSWHFVVLDANFKRDGTPYRAGNFEWTDTWIPAPQLAWLRADLARSAGRRTIVFVHQILDDEKDPHGVKNGAKVRQILEEAGNVVAVFQGHKHTGGYARIGGIHYVTLRAMVEGPGRENNAYGVALTPSDGPGRLEGFVRQPDVPLGPKRPDRWQL
ncbi:MAG TPA: alkaline phosphatase [Planctomycetaceae bacterium]|nr:alkaline phosphatase [Planctomycetaceae bacterium]